MTGDAPSRGLTIICAYDYPAAKAFADEWRWPQGSWVFAEERRLRGVEARRVVHLYGFWARWDAVELDLLACRCVSRGAQQSLQATRRDAARQLLELRRGFGDAS